MPQESVNSRPVSVDHFVKEAVQILWRANQAVAALDGTNERGSDSSADDEKGGSVTWKLNITASMITLDTNIQTIAGLEKVIEQLSTNVRPQPPAIKSPRSSQSDEYQMPGFLHSIATALDLSSVLPVQKTDIFRQFNSIQLMDQCIQTFILCDGDFFSTSKLRADTQVVLSNLSASKEHPIETLLVLSICTMMIRHVMAHNCGHPTVAAGLMQAYYAHARMLLQDLFDARDVRVIQSLMMLSVYPHGHVAMISPSRKNSSYLAMATRMALSMDLHRLDAERGENSETKEKLRRMMWMLLCADYFAERNASGGSGRISVTDWQVDFPRPLPGEQSTRRVEFLVQYCRVVMIHKLHLFRSAYRIVMVSEKALESSMDEVLFKTYMNTPIQFHIKLDPSIIDTVSKEDVEALVLKMLHSDTLIYTHIPSLPARYLETLDQEQATRMAFVSEIYNRISQSAKHDPIPNYTSFAKNPPWSDADNAIRMNMEFRTVTGCVTAASDLTLVLELLSKVDQLGCYHSPVYGTLITAHVYHMVEANSQDHEVVLLCRINLVRTMRIFQHALQTFADSMIVYLDRMLRQWITAPMEQPTSHLQRTALRLTETLRERAKMQFGKSQGHSPLNDNNDVPEIVKVESA